MVESLLFGHRRGAFTGAVSDAVGFVEAAGRGTLHLDELSSLPLEAQAKLLRVLDAREVYPVGETAGRSVDFRLVSSAQDDLTDRVRGGTFRLDLYERVAGAVLVLLPLRERPEDLLPLATHFAELQGRRLAPAAGRVLEGYDWPGNVRELRTAIERATIFCDTGAVGPDALAQAIEMGAPGDGPPPRRCSSPSSAAQREQLLAICRAHGYEARRIAVALGLALSTLYRRLQGAGISLRQHRNSHFFSENSRED
jgi:DNA-binding NtrC family response regulator